MDLFPNFGFLGLGTSFSPKRAKNFGDFKHCPIWLKFCTLFPLVNIWELFFHFKKFGLLGPWDEFFMTATIGPPNSWKNTEVEPSTLRTFD